MDESYVHKILEKICSESGKDGLAIVIPRYIVEEELIHPIPSIKLVINGSLQREDVDRAIDLLETICCRVASEGSKLK